MFKAFAYWILKVSSVDLFWGSAWTFDVGLCAVDWNKTFAGYDSFSVVFVYLHFWEGYIDFILLVGNVLWLLYKNYMTCW